MHISIKKLKSDLYGIIDHVIESGRPVTINRKKMNVKIMVEKPKSKLSKLQKHPGTIIGDPESLVHIDWSKEWNENQRSNSNDNIIT